MIATKIDLVQSGFEFRHKGSLPFLYRLPLLSIRFSSFSSILLSLTVIFSVLADFLCDAINRFAKNRFLQFAFPDDDDRPTFRFQLTPNLLVSLLISCYFRHPEISISLGNSVVLAPLMSVPETPVDKDDRAVFGEDDVRGTRKVSIIHPIPKTFSPKRTT